MLKAQSWRVDWSHGVQCSQAFVVVVVDDDDVDDDGVGGDDDPIRTRTRTGDRDWDRTFLLEQEEEGNWSDLRRLRLKPSLKKDGEQNGAKEGCGDF